MEYVGGGSLEQRLARGPLDLAGVMRLGTDLLAALGRLHGSGVLHRDVKPSNVGFDEEGTAKLLDLGLARLADGYSAGATPVHHPLDGLPDLVSTGSVGRLAGTPLYLPPEAFRGAPASAAFDLWAIATVLYEAWTGSHPFRRLTLEETIEAAEKQAYPPLPAADMSDAPLHRALRQALAPDPSSRPRTAAELGAHLGLSAA
jgi:serine/threonine protein kinase